jgi:hypothetical protein
MAAAFENLLGAGQGGSFKEAPDMETLQAQQQNPTMMRAAELAGAGVLKPNRNASSMAMRGYGSDKSELSGLLANQMFTAKDAQNLMMPVQQRMPMEGPRQSYNPQTIQYVRSLLGV